MSTQHSVRSGRIVLGTVFAWLLIFLLGLATASSAAAQDVISIDAGGTAESNSGGGDNSFVADEDYTGGSTYSVTTTITIPAGISATAAPAAVYQSARQGVSTYTIPGLTAGASYNVRLHFAELYFSAAGGRKFNVAINGTTVLTNFDIYATAGGKDTAVVEQYAATANSSGDIVIAFTNGTVDQPMVNGIEVLGTSTACSTVPSAPSNFMATATSSSAIGLSWTAVTPPVNCTISSYTVYGGTTANPTTVIANGVTGTTYSNTGLAASTTYYYLVKAVDADGTSAASTQASAETQANTSCSAVPSAPTNLTATASSSTAIGLSWTAVTPPANCTISSYTVYGGTTANPTALLATVTSGTTYNNTGLAASTTYYYLVKAVDADGTSAASNQATNTTEPASSGASIASIDAGGPGESNSGGGDNSFLADEDYTGGGTYSVTNAITIPASVSATAAPAAVYQSARQGASTYTIPGLTAGASYSVRLHFAELYFSAAGGREFNVAINGTTVLTNFDIYATAGANDTAVVQQFTATANSSGDIVIAFTNGAKDQPMINGIEVLGTSTTCSAAVPAITTLAASASSTSAIALSWTAQTPPVNCTISSYTLYGGTTANPTAVIASGVMGTTYTNTGLAASTTYYYLIKSVDAYGASAVSNQATAKTLTSGSTEIVALAAGGPAQSNAAGGDASFVADEFYNGGGANGTVTAAINLTQPGANAAPMGVYQNGRVGASTYTIPGLAAGAQYTVLLQFAETYWTTTGAREFDVAINGQPVLTNLDIYATVGLDAALVETFTATANTSGQIVIAFTTGAADQPVIAGIEIRGASSACTLLPSTPTGLTALASSPSIIGLSWIAVTPPPNCPISYNLYRSTTSGFTPAPANLIASGLTGATYSNTGLAPSTTYYYAVAAVDADGASAPSTQASQETHSATSCISVPTTTPGSPGATASTSTTIEVSWASITAPEYCTDITYNVYGSNASSFTPSLSNEIARGLTGTTFFNTGLAPGTSYYYMVQAADEDGASTAISGTTTATTLTPPTTLTAAASSANEIDLTFPASTAAGPISYNVFRSSTTPFTPSSSNELNAANNNKVNYYNDVLLAPSTTYYYIVQATGPSGTTTVGGPVGATTLPLAPNTPPFWDMSNIPATPAGDEITLKFLNRTNGQYPDSEVYWSILLAGVTYSGSVATEPTFSMPANASGRIYFYLGAENLNSNNYWDFIEYTLGTNFMNMNSTRVDQFGIKYAFRLTCGDGTDIAIGETAGAFSEDRASFFQRYINAVPANFGTLAQDNAPYQILSPSAGGFDTGGAYQTYYNAWIQQLWTVNGITLPLAIPNGDGLGSYPDLSAAIYRHVGGVAGTFNANGTLANQALWSNPNAFYQTAPASYYAQFLHANAINGRQYTFPYDDAGGYSGDVACSTPQTLVIAIGW